MEIFKTSAILFEFPQPVSGDRVHLVAAESPLAPVGIKEAIRGSWNRELLAKQAELKMVGDNMVIGFHREPISGNDLDALYEEATGKKKMWSGPVVTLRGVRIELTTDNPNVWLYVAQTHYAFTTGLNDVEVTRLYTEQGIEKPRPSLAIGTFAVTPQEQIVLTVRGNRTNKYPGRLYGQGGDPKTPDADPVLHQIGEMKQEILLEPTEYNPQEIQFAAIIEDREELPGKPDLIGWIRINKGFEEIEERVKNRGKYPNDAVAVAAIPADAEGLLRYLITTDPTRYCAPAFAGLIVYGRMNFGQDWKNDLRRELPS